METRDYDYCPDYWTIIKTPDCCKVLAGWAGGYLDGDAWKLNSGITKVEEDQNHYFFHGVTGSVYCCNKAFKRTGRANQHIYDKLIEIGCSEIEVSEIELIGDSK